MTEFIGFAAFKCWRSVYSRLLSLLLLFLILTLSVGELLIGSKFFERTFTNQSLQICLEENFFFQQFLCNYFQVYAVFGKQRYRTVIRLIDDAFYFLVNPFGSCVRIWFLKCIV